MAADFQVLSFEDSAPITEVGLYSDSPLALDIRGSKFRGVARVLINGIESPEFIVTSDRRLLAEVPASETEKAIRQVQVRLNRRGLTNTSAISFRANVPGQKAEGFTRMLQGFLRLLMTTPGEQLHDEGMGGGILSLVGSAGSIAELNTAAVQAVAKTEAEFVQLQARNPSLAASEKLQSATVLGAEFDAPTTSMRLRLSLTAMDGTTGAPVVRI